MNYVWVEFQTKDKLVYQLQVSNLKKGEFRYPYHPTVLNKGYLGIGKFKKWDNEKKTFTKVGTVWHNMLKRCYSESFQKQQPTYKGCEVCEEWLNFQIFAEWFYNNYKEGYELDKDLLFFKNKIYSPNTCCFIPKRINLFLSGQNKGKTPGISKQGNLYYAEITFRSERKKLGSFKTYAEARTKYKEIRKYIAKKLRRELRKEGLGRRITDLIKQ